MISSKKYCSSCKHSKYVLDIHGQKRLRCSCVDTFGRRAQLLTVDCTYARVCDGYDPEQLRDSLTSRHCYELSLRKCGIPPREEFLGRLSHIRLK